jgi:hypothetical protein
MKLRNNKDITSSSVDTTKPAPKATRATVRTIQDMVAGGSMEMADNNVEALQAEIQSLNVYIEELHAYLDRRELLLCKFGKPTICFLRQEDRFLTIYNRRTTIHSYADAWSTRQYSSTCACHSEKDGGYLGQNGAVYL